MGCKESVVHVFPTFQCLALFYIMYWESIIQNGAFNDIIWCELMFLMSGAVRNRRTEIECTDTNTVNANYAEV